MARRQAFMRFATGYSLLPRASFLFVCFMAGRVLLAFDVPQESEASNAPILRSDTRVVQIDVSVKDPSGRPVTDLTKQNFSVLDNGKPRSIDIFVVNRGELAQPTSFPSRPAAPNVFSNRNARPPVASSHSSIILIDSWVNLTRQAVIGLMSKVPADERVALYVVSPKQGLMLLQDYTTNHELLLKNFGIYIPPGWGGRFIRESLQTLAEHLALMPGRKSVFWLTVGLPYPTFRSTPASWVKTFKALNEANVAVSPVDLCGVCTTSNASTLLTEMEVASETGGHALFGRNDVDAMVAQAIEDSRMTYTLGFYLPESERTDTHHSLKVLADRQGLNLSYRQGYNAGNTEMSASVREKKDDLETALLNEIDSDGVGITAQVDVTRGDPRGTVAIRLQLDPGSLSLKEQAGGWSGETAETFVELNESGHVLAKISDTKDFQVPDAARAAFDRSGVGWPVSIPLMQGATKIVIAVRDSGSLRVGSLTVPLN